MLSCLFLLLLPSPPVRGFVVVSRRRNSHNNSNNKTPPITILRRFDMTKSRTRKRCTDNEVLRLMKVMESGNLCMYVCVCGYCNHGETAAQGAKIHRGPTRGAPQRRCRLSSFSQNTTQKGGSPKVERFESLSRVLEQTCWVRVSGLATNRSFSFTVSHYTPLLYLHLSLPFNLSMSLVLGSCHLVDMCR